MNNEQPFISLTNFDIPRRILSRKKYIYERNYDERKKIDSSERVEDWN